MTPLPEMLKSFDDKFPRLVISINESPIGFRDERVEADGIVMRNFLTEVWNSAYIAGLEEAKKVMYKSLDEVAQYKNDQCKTLVNKEDIKVWIHNLSDLSTNQK
jgi:hypothetical protein